MQASKRRLHLPQRTATLGLLGPLGCTGLLYRPSREGGVRVQVTVSPRDSKRQGDSEALLLAARPRPAAAGSAGPRALPRSTAAAGRFRPDRGPRCVACMPPSTTQRNPRLRAAALLPAHAAPAPAAPERRRRDPRGDAARRRGARGLCSACWRLAGDVLTPGVIPLPLLLRPAQQRSKCAERNRRALTTDVGEPC